MGLLTTLDSWPIDNVLAGVLLPMIRWAHRPKDSVNVLRMRTEYRFKDRAYHWA